MKKLILSLFLCSFITTIYSQIPKEKLLNDYDILVTELKTYHQGLYQYVEKSVIDQKIDSIRKTIESSNKIEFFKKVNALIALTKEGHTGAELPFWTQSKFGLSKSFIPIKIKFSDKKAIITKYFAKDNPGLNFGDQLISINGRTIEQIMQKLRPYIVTDGFNETSFYEWVSWNFPIYYTMAYGKEKKFDIKVKEFNSEKVKTLTLNGRNILKQKDKKNTLNTIIIKNEFDYYSISDSIFYLSIPNFYSLDDFETFYEKVFKIIKEKNTKHLIIDVQNNIGGEEGNENLLASYLFKEAFQKYESVIIPIAAYDNFKKSKSAIADGWALSNKIPHRGKFTLMSDYFSEFGYKKPNQELVYTGKVYVLTSGVTFSGGAEFASMLKMTNRAVFIGEETGGAYEGNVSGESGVLKLPKTKIKVSIPLVHFKMAVHPEIRGRGVMPDYKVSQDWEDIIKGKNSKLEFALKLIEKNTR